MHYDTLTHDEALRVRDDVNHVLRLLETHPESRKAMRFTSSPTWEAKVVGGAPFASHWHLASSCRMGSDGVVDEACAVHGVSGLYIGDASVARATSTYNTMSLAYFAGYVCGRSVATRLGVPPSCQRRRPGRSSKITN